MATRINGVIGFFLITEVLLCVLEKPRIIIIIFLLHKTFFDNDCEDIGNYTDRNEDVGIKV